MCSSLRAVTLRNLGVRTPDMEQREIRRATRFNNFLYCHPTLPKAGEDVMVFYSPDHSPLKGAQELYIYGGWNRHAHPLIVPATLMEPTTEPEWFCATLQVPPDAHILDLVIKDSPYEGQGRVDDHHRMGYHFPTKGSKSPHQILHILHTAVEMAPVAKVGGMGDVVTALSRALQEKGHRVDVVLPKFDILKYDQISNLHKVDSFEYDNVKIAVWTGTVEEVNVTFLDPQNGMFCHGCIYGRNDDHVRFGFFARATACWVRILASRGDRPDVVHAHDWQTGPALWDDLSQARTAFTIHNLEYGADLIAGAMAAADIGTTVSPSYAQEVKHHGSVSQHQHKFTGIINGIDYTIWDPSNDIFIPSPYDFQTVVEGKAAAKHELRSRLRMEQREACLMGVVSRLVGQKGIHLIKETCWKTLEGGGQFVLLGSAPDPRIQGEFEQLAYEASKHYPGQVAHVFNYDEPLSHLIYSGSDMIAVPSLFEPCGLTQMIAMRYGAVPFVRRTGGLRDSVFDVDDDQERAMVASLEPNGFSFDGTDEGSCSYALSRALHYWRTDREYWNSLARLNMEQDWSWNYPAMDYIDSYFSILRPIRS